MKKRELFSKASKIWQDESVPVIISPKLLPDLETHKRLLKLFHVGDFYCYIFDLKRLELVYISPEIDEVLGKPEGEWTVHELMDRLHPDDVEFFMAAEREIGRFFASLPAEKAHLYKARYDVRLRRTDGVFLRILMQIVVFESDPSKNELKSFSVHTDITHLKQEARPVLSFIGMEGEPSYIDVTVNRGLIKTTVFTPREMEILPLLVNGMTSSEIAAILNISKHTVDTHRRKMLREVNLRSTTELTNMALKEGWV